MAKETLRATALPEKIERLGLKGRINFMGAAPNAITVVALHPFRELRGGLDARTAHFYIEGIADGFRLVQEEVEPEE